LGEWQVAELIEDDEVEPHEMLGQAARPPCTDLGLKPVHEVHDIEESAASAVADDGSLDRHGDVGLAGPGAADQHDIALLAEEFPAGQIAHQRLVDRRIIEGELLDLPGIGQLGGGDLVFDRPASSSPTI